MPSVALLAIIAALATCVPAREVYKFDFNWRFEAGDQNRTACQPGTFPLPMNDIQCQGLSQVPAVDADDCAAACCADPNCQTYQWCPSGTACTSPNQCWIGLMEGCGPSKGWVSQGRNTTGPGVTNCTVPQCQTSYNDSDWRAISVPHDFVIEGTFTPDAQQSHGYLPQGSGWYRKRFTLPAFFKGQSIWLEFDGVYRNSNAYLNGVFLGNHQSGYTSFRYDITNVPGVVYGSDNVLAVHVDATHSEGWWYEGGGIYRHVWLVVAAPVHIAPWGVYAPSQVTSPIFDGPAGQMGAAQFTVETDVVNDLGVSSTVSLSSVLYAPNGTQVASATSKVTIDANANLTVAHTLAVGPVPLWSPDYPNLFKLISIVLGDDGSVLDEVSTTLGVRKVVFDNTKGLLVNDRAVKVKGLCNHQDFAGVGVAVPNRINRFRVQKLQEMGANAWRMSHNPPNPELLAITDELGMLVWDENRNFENQPTYFDDLVSMITRDRNHPSIVIWSLCNEGGCQEGVNDTQALATAQAFKETILEYDTTRPVSGAWNAQLDSLLWGWGPKVMDVQGVNYNYGEIDPYHQMYPTKPMISSETASCTCARGVYVTNDTAAHKDIFSCDGCAREWWTADQTRGFIAGGFAWTGFDYKGEPTPYAWPEINSNFGILDIAGFPKDTFYYYQSWWTNETVVHVFPHWNNPYGTEGVGLYVAPCDASFADEHFVFVSGAQGTQLRSVGGLCADATCSDLSSGCYPLPLVPCDSSAAGQLFDIVGATVVSKANKGCLDVFGGSGPKVGVYQCNGGDNQKWVYNASAQTLAPAAPAGYCLIDTPAAGVWVYSNAPFVELLINGVSAGRKAVPALGNAIWSAAYAPGSLVANAYGADGSFLGSDTVVTSGAAFAVSLSIEVGADGILADGQDVALLTATVVDAAGNIVPTAGNNISFVVDGAGSILGVGNGDPACHEPDKATWRSAFNGLARAIVQASTIPGTITVTAKADGLEAGSVGVTVVLPPSQRAL
eukprot:m.15788 g.15788  ORF g.15788 m.15788 type:complete len:1005 (+) comp3068_c0_seq1:28-3042(+)